MSSVLTLSLLVPTWESLPRVSAPHFSSTERGVGWHEARGWCRMWSARARGKSCELLLMVRNEARLSASSYMHKVFVSVTLGLAFWISWDFIIGNIPSLPTCLTRFIVLKSGIDFLEGMQIG